MQTDFQERNPDRLPDQRILPLLGWPILPCTYLDEIAPGFLRFVTRSRLVLRHALFAAFSKSVVDDPASFIERATGEPVDETRSFQEHLREMAEVLQTLRPQQIIEAAWGSCPNSLLGALDKIGVEPLAPEGYWALFRTFAATDAESRARRKVLEQLSTLDDDLLEAVLVIDLALISPVLVTRIKTGERARAFNARLATIRACCSTATDQALKESITRAAQWTSVEAWAREWLSRADGTAAFDLPLPDDVQIVTPTMTSAIGREWRNCLRQYRGRVASGNWAVLIWRAENVLVTATRLSGDGWLLTGVHAHRNGGVGRDVLEKVAEKFTPLGITCLLPAKSPEGFDFEPRPFGGEIFDFEFAEA